jgi:sec-independent protein translocase protein TatC
VIEPAQEEPGAAKVMSLIEHLNELRRRVFIGVLAVVAGTIVGFLLAPQAIALLKEPIPGPLFFTQPAGGLFLQLKLALMIGIALGSPVLLYQFWAFISPGLTARERALARPWIPLSLIFLVGGIALAYAVLPFTAAFLLGWQIEGVVQPLITVDAYFGFVTMMFLTFGLVMQFPIVLILLAKVGIINADRLRRSRRYALLGIALVAMLVTPQDPWSMIIMTIVMYPLYELAIVMVARSTRRPAADAELGGETDG